MQAVGLVVLLAAVLIERYLSGRVLFDALVFGRLADGTLPSLQVLDAALRGVLNVGAHKTGRPLAPRIAGAQRLYCWQWISTLILVVGAIGAWWPC